jgi:hypothetical protein
MALTTPEAVIHRAGLAAHPEYEDVSPMADCAGFYAFRPYPPTTELARIVTSDGRPAVRCYLRFVVACPAPGSHISRINLRAWFSRRWRPGGRIIASTGNPDDAQAGHPDVPSPQSRVVLARARKPVDLDEIDMPDFIYDNREDAFLDGQGRAVTPRAILEELYAKHCRTLRLGFRIRWSIGSLARRAIRSVVWTGQDAAMWALVNLYDIELMDDRKDRLRDFFYKYKPSDFRRATEKPGERSHFFGFQSSRKSLITNLSVVVVGCLFAYWTLPHAGLLRAIYNNTALTTAALITGFLIADTLGPWLLIGIVCTLSRFRDAVLFFIRKVKV